MQSIKDEIEVELTKAIVVGELMMSEFKRFEFIMRYLQYLVHNVHTRVRYSAMPISDTGI